jgi:hypothetical protein
MIEEEISIATQKTMMNDCGKGLECIDHAIDQEGLPFGNKRWRK